MKQTIVILHGWGLSGEKYSSIRDIFEKENFTVLSPDFPGFGTTSLIKATMNMDDYVDFLKKYLKDNTRGPVVLIGHSFGGRVAAKFCALKSNQVSALVLTGAPLIRKPLSFRKKIIQRIVKNAKKLVPAFLEEVVRKNTYRFLGEWDYYKAGKLKETLKNVLSEDIFPNLSKIHVPTLLLWGEKDTFVSVEIGKEIAKNIQNAQLEIVEGGTHKLPYESPSLFAKKVLAFLRKEL